MKPTALGRESNGFTQPYLSHIGPQGGTPTTYSSSRFLAIFNISFPTVVISTINMACQSAHSHRSLLDKLFTPFRSGKCAVHVLASGGSRRLISTTTQTRLLSRAHTHIED